MKKPAFRDPTGYAYAWLCPGEQMEFEFARWSHIPRGKAAVAHAFRQSGGNEKTVLAFANREAYRLGCAGAAQQKALCLIEGIVDGDLQIKAMPVVVRAHADGLKWRSNHIAPGGFSYSDMIKANALTAAIENKGGIYWAGTWAEFARALRTTPAAAGRWIKRMGIRIKRRGGALAIWRSDWRRLAREIQEAWAPPSPEAATVPPRGLVSASLSWARRAGRTAAYFALLGFIKWRKGGSIADRLQLEERWLEARLGL